MTCFLMCESWKSEQNTCSSILSAFSFNWAKSSISVFFQLQFGLIPKTIKHVGEKRRISVPYIQCKWAGRNRGRSMAAQSSLHYWFLCLVDRLSPVAALPCSPFRYSQQYSALDHNQDSLNSLAPKPPLLIKRSLKADLHLCFDDLKLIFHVHL